MSAIVFRFLVHPKCCYFGYFLPAAVAEPEVLPLRLLSQSLIQAGAKKMN